MTEHDTRVDMSAHLRDTLQRAGSYASEQSHRFVTIEHILLALNEDPDAELMLQACSIDQGRLHADISAYLGRLEDRIAPGEPVQPALDGEAARIVNSAVIAAQKSRRSEVNGAIVLAAIIGDGRTPAANMLRTQGLTFQGAIEALQSAQTAARSHNNGHAPGLPHTRPRPASQQSTPPAAEPPAPTDGDRGEAGGGGPQPSITEGALAEARRRVAAQRAQEQRPQPPQNGTENQSADQHPPAPAPAADKPATPSAPASQPLQTEDSLARFERRPPPQVPTPPQQQSAPASSQQSPPPDQSGPPTALKPVRSKPTPPPLNQPPHELDPSAAPAPRPLEPPPQAPPPVQPPPTFAGEALRRPPPPEAMRPAPPPEPIPRQNPPPPSGRADNPNAAYAGPRAPPGGADRERSYPPAAPAPQPTKTKARAAPGQLIENIPRRMCAGIAEQIEIRIARASLQNLGAGMRGAAAHHHVVMVTKAMSVRLRAPDGGFYIETASPETQWTDNHLGVLSDDYASWRWSVTPRRAGRARLQLIVSARTMGGDGLMAETALPDQIFDVRITTNYGRLAARWTGWAAAAIVGGLLARFGEDLLTLGQLVLRGGLGG